MMSLPLRPTLLRPAHWLPESVAHFPAELVAHFTGIRTHLHKCPHTYVGARHRVLVKGYPYTLEEPGECVIQEYPGPGPELKFDFDRDGRRTILVEFVESDGDGHTKPYWPEGHPGANPAPPAGNREAVQ
jgi:hypothetical protein